MQGAQLKNINIFFYYSISFIIVRILYSFSNLFQLIRTQIKYIYMILIWLKVKFLK